MVSIQIIGIALAVFLAFGGISLTQTAFSQVKSLASDVKKQLGISEDTSSGSPEDRDVENK